jgi:L-aminopeptidase/D-esterase-like protein
LLLESTTLVVAPDAALSKAQAKPMAVMAQDGLALIRPARGAAKDGPIEFVADDGLFG